MGATRGLRPGRLARLGAKLPTKLRRRAEALPGPLAPPVAAGSTTPRVAIVGTGFGGMGMAARLKQAGIHTFTVFEKSDGVGGTWRDNTYPGAACDVPSHLYSLSFVPNPEWSRKFPTQPEIHSYLESIPARTGIGDHIEFGAEVRSLEWDDDSRTWAVTLVGEGGERTEQFDAVVAAKGQLNRPHIPDVAGLDDFAGPMFHSARWDHDVDLTVLEATFGCLQVGAVALVGDVELHLLREALDRVCVQLVLGPDERRPQHRLLLVVADGEQKQHEERPGDQHEQQPRLAEDLDDLLADEAGGLHDRPGPADEAGVGHEPFSWTSPTSRMNTSS